MGEQQDSIERLVEEYRVRKMDRRMFLRRAFALGLAFPTAAALLAACQAAATSAPQPTAAPPASAAAPSSAATSAPVTTASALTSAPASASSAAASGSTGSKILHFRSTIPYQILDPADIATGMDTEASYPVAETLVGYKPGSTDVVNVLAETFTPSADGMTLAFTLKQGIQFHGGFGELTAEDVKHSYERAAGLTSFKGKSGWGPFWSSLKGVTVKDKYSGTIDLKAPNASFFSDNVYSYIGGITSKAAAAQMGDKFELQPIGTGPYFIESIDPAQGITLTRFSGWGGASKDQLGISDVYYDQLIGKVLDEPTASIALQTGEVDFTRFDDANNVKTFVGNAAFKNSAIPTGWVYFLAFNFQDPILKDINVRQAIRYAINVDQVITASYGNSARAFNLVSQPLMPYPSSSKYDYEQNVATAKSYLAKSNLTSVDLTLTYPSYSAKPVAVIQAQLAAIGINVTLNLLQSGQSFSKSDQLTYHAWSILGDAADNTGFFLCNQIDQQNPDRYCNAMYDTLNAQEISETDPTKRLAIIGQMMDILDRDVVAVWITNATLQYEYKATLAPVLSKVYGDTRYQAFRPA